MSTLFEDRKPAGSYTILNPHTEPS